VKRPRRHLANDRGPEPSSGKTPEGARGRRIQSGTREVGDGFSPEGFRISVLLVGLCPALIDGPLLGWSLHEFRRLGLKDARQLYEDFQSYPGRSFLQFGDVRAIYLSLTHSPRR
jgi:hypothetical protein